MVFRLRGGRRAAQRASVKAALEGDDLVALRRRVQAGEFDRGFVRLRARIAEECLPVKAVLGQQLGPSPLYFDVPGIRHVN